MENIVEQFIKDNLSLSNFSKKYNISMEKLINALHSNGYLYAKPRVQTRLILNLKWASDEFLNNPNINRESICIKYNINHETFSKYLKDYLHIPFEKRLKPQPCSNIFDSIDTEEKAYWLGFLFADGAVSSSPLKDGKKNYNIELSLKIEDKEHLLKFYKFSKATTKFVIDSYRCRVTLNDKHLWETLVSYGCTPNKSLTLRFPSFLGKAYIIPFIRGYFDGDGCISYTDMQHKHLCIQLLGTNEFLTILKSFCPKEIQELNLHHNHNNIEEETMFFSTSHNKAVLFLHFIYDNAIIYLDRKYKRFAHYISNNINAESKNGEGCDANLVLTN